MVFNLNENIYIKLMLFIHMEEEIYFCPKCKKKIEAKDYFATAGLSDWRADTPGVNIRCSNPKCNYEGPPLESSKKDYTDIKFASSSSNSANTKSQSKDKKKKQKPM